MRPMLYVAIGVFLGAASLLTMNHLQSEPPLASLSQAEASSKQPEAAPLSAQDLFEMARIYDEQADELQAEAAQLERKALSLAEKPHLDPKGYRRAGLMNIARLRWQAASEHRQLAAMHRNEAERMDGLARQK